MCRQRLWRLRKDHWTVDAELVSRSSGVEVQFIYRGTLAYVRRWRVREEALDDAMKTRRELERTGWIAHW